MLIQPTQKTVQLISDITSTLDYCLELSKMKVLKMLDSQTKSAINSNNFQVQHQATSRAFRITDTKHISQHPDNI